MVLRETAMTASVDGRVHWIPDDAFDLGVHVGGCGEFEALCGDLVSPAPTSYLASGDCPVCAAFHLARATLHELRLDPPRRSWWPLRRRTGNAR